MAAQDDARTIGFDERAPADERYDAQAVLQRDHRALRSELIPTAQMAEVISYIQDGFAEQQMAKSAQVIQFPVEHTPRKKGERGPKAVYLDDLQIFVSGDYYEKPSPLGFEGLRQMVEQTPILNSIIMTRIRQVSRFCQVSEDGGEGFEIRHVDRAHELTPEEKQSTALLARFIQNCGWEWNPRARKRLKRDNFTQFMAKSVRDSLTMDACPIETEMKRDRSLGIDGFTAVDGSTVRLCTEAGYEGNDEIFALQVLQSRIATAFTHDSLIYEVRNPRTDVRLAGYGLGETELLIRVVTGFLNAMQYNSDGFDKNAIPKGILNLIGDYADTDLVSFKRYWNMMVKGINNRWSLPVMVSKDSDSKASFTPLGEPVNEMAFAKWMTLLSSIACAIYGMDPAEINFESFSASKSSLSGSDTEERLANSKDSGLRPLMAFYESTISDFIISEFDPKFCFRWVGLQREDEDKAWEGKKLILTVDEMRAEQGYEPHPDPKIGGLPVNPALIGPALQLNQPAQPGTDFGAPAPEPGPDYGNPDAEGGAPGQGEAQAGPGDQGQPPAPGQAEAAPAGDSGRSGGDFGKALTTIYSLGG